MATGIVVAVSGALVARLVGVATMARPIADDFGLLLDIRVNGVWDTYWIAITFFTGRLTSSFLGSASVGLLGPSAIAAVPAVGIVALFVADATCASVVLGRACGDGLARRLRLLAAVALGALVTATVVLVAPSPFDLTYWMTSNFVYFSAVVASAVVAVVLLNRLGALERHPVLDVSMVVIVGVVAAMLNEPMTIWWLLVLSLALACCVLGRVSLGLPRPVLLRRLVAATVAFAVGLGVLYLMPGAVNRRGNLETASLGLWASFRRSLGATLHMIGHSMDPDALVLLVAGTLVVGLSLGLLHGRASMHRVVLLSWVTLPVVAAIAWVWVVAFVAIYAGTAYGDGFTPPLRTQGLATAMFCTCLAVSLTAAAAGLTRLPGRVAPATSRALLTAVLLSLTVVFVAAAAEPWRTTGELDAALRRRAESYDARDAAARRALRRGDDPVALAPVPVSTLVPSEAVDLETAGVVDWIAVAVANYYGVYGSSFVVTSSAGTVTDLTRSAVPTSPPRPPDVRFPFGLVGFRVTGLTPGGTASVTIMVPALVGDANLGGDYWKLQRGAWYRVPSARVTGNQITLELTDGGTGDADGTADGIIVDPGAPARPAKPRPERASG